MFMGVVVTNGAPLDQFDWPRTLRSQVSIYNIDFHNLAMYNITEGWEVGGGGGGAQ